ncbi:MAG TPA: cytochrome c oxidase subunit II, partial [Candidatus Binatia bacterium]|nr:cytochrome c oxidase subunit II [Candidatus Binatia bacterium]
GSWSTTRGDEQRSKSETARHANLRSRVRGVEILMSPGVALKAAEIRRRGLLVLKVSHVALLTAALLGVAAVLIASPAIAAEPSEVTTIFKPLSTPARAIHEVSLLVLAICAGIFLVVGGLLVYTVVRFRRRPGDDGREPPQIYGSNQLEFAWTVIPIVVVFVLFLATARTIYDVQGAAPPADALNVTLVGRQWWWEIRYPELGIVTANELHVPVSESSKPRPTFLKLESADVAHSFWVPQLAGKTDLIPNRENLMWIEPTEPGTYLGNCAEYCGMQHAHMQLRVIVHPPGGFEKWAAAQREPPVDDPRTRADRDVFFATACINCHTIRGTQAMGTFGPDLTHLMSRETLGAGTVPNTAEKLRDWVRDPQTIKEGCNMPNMQLTENELNHVVAYLLTLK